MADYIDREKLIKAIENDACELVFYGKPEAISCIEAAPAADIRPVVRGRWIKQDDDPLDGNFYCSACHSGIDIATGSETPIDREMFYCPSCGADMRGESGSEE